MTKKERDRLRKQAQQKENHIPEKELAPVDVDNTSVDETITLPLKEAVAFSDDDEEKDNESLNQIDGPPGASGGKVMTKEEYEALSRTPENKPIVIGKITSAPAQIVYCYQSAPAGESRTHFAHRWKGKIYQYEVTLSNRCFTLPDDLEEDEINRYRAALEANGFVDGTILDALPSPEKKEAPKRYMVIHPEQTVRSNVAGTTSVAVKNAEGGLQFHTDGPDKGKQIIVKVDLRHGIAVTEDKAVYEALLEMGFRHLKVEEIE